MYTPKSGNQKGKNYLFVESNKRWTTIRNYIRNRPEQFKDSKFLLILHYENNKWEKGTYSLSPHSNKIPLPHIIYDIQRDKVYEYKGQLWTITNLKKLEDKG